MLLYAPFHMYRQLREAYGLSRFGAWWRTWFLALFALLALILFAVALTVLVAAGYEPGATRPAQAPCGAAPPENRLPALGIAEPLTGAVRAPALGLVGPVELAGLEQLVDFLA